MPPKKRFLFFFVHPSKYYLFRETINHLKKNGHIVDIAIISKDILEDLIINEGWEYTNIFPEGRRSKSTKKWHIILSTGINFLKTVWRLHKLTAKKKYDIYVTDDCLTITGWYRRTPSYIFCDDDFSVVKETGLLFKTANHIISPDCTDMGKYNNKKVSFKGYKGSSYLHPKVFNPEKKILEKYNLNGRVFFLIRLVSLTASHDIGKKGISDSLIKDIINLLENKGKIVISSEKELSVDVEKYRLNIKPHDILHILAHAKIFISDSQTMSMEAAFLGVPFIRYNDFIGKISYLNELENKYRMGFGVPTKDKAVLLEKTTELINIENVEIVWKNKRDVMIKETVNLNDFLIKVFSKE